MEGILKWAIGGDRQNAERGFIGALFLCVMYASSFIAVTLATAIAALCTYGVYGTVDRGIAGVMMVAGVSGFLCGLLSVYTIYDVRSNGRWSLCTVILRDAASDK